MISFYIGDKVKVKVFAHSDEGTVVGKSDKGTFYYVEFIDKHGSPFTYCYEPHELIKVETLLTKCECGAIYVVEGDQFHSIWCPRYVLRK